MVTIYTLSDPLTKMVRYVGKTTQPLATRFYQHIADVNKCHKKNWITSLSNKGLKPIIEVLDIVNDEEWSEAEQFYIGYLRFIGLDLTNMTNGGESGEMSMETRKKISQKNTGLKRSDATKLKLSELNKAGIIGRKGKTHTSISKNKISAALVGTVRPESVKEKVRLANMCRRKPVLQLSKSGVLIKEWESINSAAKELGFCKGHIIKVCKGSVGLDGYKVKTSYGYKWEYKTLNNI